MKRRRRGLGSSPAEHYSRAERAASNARDAADHAVREATGGHCNGALVNLQDAAVNYGEWRAEVAGAGGTVTSGNKTHLAVERARTAVRAHCLVPRR